MTLVAIGCILFLGTAAWIATFPMSIAVEAPKQHLSWTCDWLRRRGRALRDRSLLSSRRRRTPCGPGRAQGRGVRRLVRVLRAHCDLPEARVLDGGADARIRVEVLVVLLAKGIPVTGPRELDPGLAGTGGGIHDTADHEVVPRRLTRDYGVGDGEVHHPVGVEVEDEPTGRPKAAGHRANRRLQLVPTEVVEAVERADRRVEDTLDLQVGESHPAQRHLGPKALASDGQHRVGCVDADDPVAPRDQPACEEAGAAAEVEHGAYALRVGTPELMEERRPTVMAGVDDDLVVAPCEPRVRLDGPHSDSGCGPSEAEDLGLGGRELLIGEHALVVELR